jgi:hypothetical protein
MAVKRVVEGVHVVPMGMANAYPIEGIEVIHVPGLRGTGRAAAVPRQVGQETGCLI